MTLRLVNLICIIGKQIEQDRDSSNNEEIKNYCNNLLSKIEESSKSLGIILEHKDE